MFRRPLLAIAVAAAVALIVPPSQARAQFFGGAGGVDPFSLYFGYYLPHQAYVAAQPNPLDTINQITAQRQFNAVTDRAGLYDPISPYGEEDLDPLRPYSPNRKGERLPKPQLFANSTTNARGTGPALYYNRTARYYPHIRPSIGPNRNLGVARRSGGGMGGGGGYGGGGMGGMSPR